MTNAGWIIDGDWVSGVSYKDEKFIGFVVKNDADGALKVVVTQSDRKEIVGETIQVKLGKVKKMQEQPPSAPGELNSLIELALGTHDKTWFEELTARKSNVPSTSGEWSGKFGGKFKGNPRLHGLTTNIGDRD